MGWLEMASWGTILEEESGLGDDRRHKMTPDPQSKMMIQMLNSWWALACTSQKRCCLDSRLAGSRGPH